MKPFLSLIRFVVLSVMLFGSTLSFAEPTWIDVRSLLEHKIDHIEGDIRIAHSDIVDGVSELFPDKNTELRLYCRSGARSGKALNALKEAGYTNVSNAGGIEDARKERGLSDD